MQVQVLATGSKGNCYLVKNSDTTLLIECGIPLKKIRETVGRITDINACLVTHQHLDHSKYINEIATYNIPTYSTKESFKGVPERQHNYLVHKESFRVGSLNITPLEMFHDVECYGFLISDKEETLFFATDTGRVPYKVNANIIMIECNHDRERLQTHDMKRVGESHLSYERVMDWLKHQDLTKTREIILLHASERNGNIDEYIAKVRDTYNIPVRDIYKGSV